MLTYQRHLMKHVFGIPGERLEFPCQSVSSSPAGDVRSLHNSDRLRMEHTSQCAVLYIITVVQIGECSVCHSLTVLFCSAHQIWDVVFWNIQYLQYCTVRSS